MTNEEKFIVRAVGLWSNCIRKNSKLSTDDIDELKTLLSIVIKTALEWKNEQFANILEETYEMRKEICRSNVSFSDCTELIQRIRKKLEE